MVVEALTALFVGLPTIPWYMIEHMDSMTPLAGKDGPEWVQWFKNRRIPSSIEEAQGAIEMMLRAYQAHVDDNAEHTRRVSNDNNRMLADRDARVTVAVARAEAAERELAALRAAPVLKLKAAAQAVAAEMNALSQAIEKAIQKLRGRGKMSFSVKMVHCGPNKITTIKALRELTGLGLKEAKDLVDSAPNFVLKDADAPTAELYTTKLREAGATVELI